MGHVSCHVTLQLVEVLEGEQLLDFNQHGFHLMTGYELCVCEGEGVCKGVCVRVCV